MFTSAQCGDWSDGCWSDPTYDALYEKQRGIMDRQERLVVVQEAQRYLYDQIPGIVLAYPGWVQAYRSDRFAGWVPAPGAHGYLLAGLQLRLAHRRAPGRDVPRGATGSSGVPGWLWLVVIGGIAVTVVLFRRRRGARRGSLSPTARSA